VRIRGGTAAAYYVGVESAMPAVPGFPPPLRLLCVAPFGMEEGTEAPLPPYEFGVVVGEPVNFRFFASTVRREDPVGALLDQWSEDEVQELAEIEVTLPPEHHQPGEVVPVRLAASYTEVGTLRLEAVAKDSGERWKIEFEVRGKQPPGHTDTEPMDEPVGAVIEQTEQRENFDEAKPAREERVDAVAEQTEYEKKEQKASFWPFKK
jgi:hypothetical protein